jgi:hypothetical protein
MRVDWMHNMCLVLIGLVASCGRQMLELLPSMHSLCDSPVWRRAHRLVLFEV